MAFPQSPVQRTRPGTVTAAVYGLFALAALQLIGLILQVTAVGPTLDATREALAGTPEADAAVTFTKIISYSVLGFGLLFAIGYVLLAFFTNKGRNGARITAWVILGISLCCGAVGLAGTAAGNAMGGGDNAGAVDQAEVNRRIEEALPSWHPPVVLTIGVISILLSLAVIILLALPASNAFFRKADPAFEPPMPGSVYPSPGDLGQSGQYPPPPGQSGQYPPSGS
jgi:hypothetical protein